MKTQPTASRHVAAMPAALQRLVWTRGAQATWRTIQVFKTCAEAEKKLSQEPLDGSLRVLSGLAEALVVGALIRDSLPHR